jgi:hypothetical protein
MNDHAEAHGTPRLWHVIVSPTRRPLFEVRPLVYDAILRDWREEAPRLLAVSWLGAEALVPRGLMKLAVGESGAWFGPVSAGVRRAA